MKKIVAVFILFLFCTVCINAQRIEYPKSKKVDQVDDYHGTKVSDPYRWLEDVNSPETATWVKEQNKVTSDYFSKIPFRERLKKRFTELVNFERYSSPSKYGDYYIYSKNDGLQERAVIYIQKGLNGKPEVLIDPNKLSVNGPVSVTGTYVSHDNKYICYSISRGGSDWSELFVIDLASKKQLSDHIKWSKFSGASWYKDGFYYAKYDQPKAGEELKQKNEFQKLCYHKLGTDQSEDKVILEDKEHPLTTFYASATEDEKYLTMYVSNGLTTGNMIWYKELGNDNPVFKLTQMSDSYSIILENIGDKFFVLTNEGAPNYKIMLADSKETDKSKWKTLIKETKDVIQDFSYFGGKLFITYLKNSISVVNIYDLEGKQIGEVKLPSVGTVVGFGGRRNDKETFYVFSSYTYPPAIYKYDIAGNKSTLFRQSKLKFNPSLYETKQIFYESKDGTKVPMFITYKKGIKLNGNSPALLYAYGGFSNPMMPGFKTSIIPLLDNGGVYAVACLRGGGEYGETWHKAGMLEKKQNVFDDFISAAEWLIKNKYTSSNKLAIQGGSNGGLLVGAVVNQRPELFKVAIPQVGVMDMLRFHKFTVGSAWVPEYGSSDKPDQFKFLYNYSPLHNIKKGIDYPATLVTTADHDDRVFPAHSFKYVAALQELSSGKNPAFIRIETQVGHGTGTTTSQAIELSSDMFSFMFYNMGIKPKL